MSTLAEEAREFAALTRQKRDLQAQLDSLNESLTQKEEALLVRFGDEGVESVKVNVGKEKFTLFPRREVWANVVPGGEKKLFTLLRRNHYGDLIRQRVNTQSLSALIREMEQSGKGLPATWASVVKVTERYRVAARKAV